MTPSASGMLACRAHLYDSLRGRYIPHTVAGNDDDASRCIGDLLNLADMGVCGQAQVLDLSIRASQPAYRPKLAERYVGCSLFIVISYHSQHSRCGQLSKFFHQEQAAVIAHY